LLAWNPTAVDRGQSPIERCEQGCDAMTLVIVGHRSTLAGLQRQTRLGAIEHLDLAFLIDRDDDGMVGSVHVEADDILDLAGECGLNQ
jgi:hypothetical protein